MKNKLISVIIPMYNAEKTIENTLRSIINQAYDNLEIIVINDGSTDYSYEICQKLKRQDNRIVIINKKNSGVGEARNLGLKIFNGDYVSFVDADDVIDRDFFSQLYVQIEKHNADVVEGNVRVQLLGNLILYPYKFNNEINIFSTEDYLKNYLLFRLNTSVWGKLYTRDIIKNVKFPNLCINEDFIFNWSIGKKVKTVVEVQSTDYCYDLSKENTLSKKPFRHENMSMMSYIDGVVTDTKKLYPNLMNFALNHYNACLLHNLILYYNYLCSPNCDNLYIEEGKEMLKRFEGVQTISDFLLRNEADYDLSSLKLSISKKIKGGQKL